MNSSATMNLDGNSWLLSTDPENVGRNLRWYDEVTGEAKATRVPGILQETFPTYHGVVWYWREFTPPDNPHEDGRYLLNFWQVDYLADVWVNGKYVGQHEGTGDPFTLDVTEPILPRAVNRVAVRVLNPKNEPIDGISLMESPVWARGIPCTPGLALNYGGITDSVELHIVPAVRVADLFVKPDWKTGNVRVGASLYNARNRTVSAELLFSIAPAISGSTLNSLQLHREIPPGETFVEAELTVGTPHLWELNDPYMYRVSVSACETRSASIDEHSTRCGFRDFRFEDGYFRLNERRIFVKCAQTDARAPIGHLVAHDPDLPRRDLINCKATRHNMIRSFGGQTPRYQIELCDEIGLLVYQEHAAAWRMEPSPKLPDRFRRSVQAMVKRDRNHPSVVIWGMLNETHKGPIYDQALAGLPYVRELDDTRVVLLNSGDFAETGKTIANSKLEEWEATLLDVHPYKTVPHRADVIQELRTLDKDGKPIFHSEGGIGSAIDVVRLTRHYEQLGSTSCEDAAVVRHVLDQFTADWERWNLGDTFPNPEDYFHQCIAWMAELRKLAANALRANPNLIAYNITGLVDPSTTGEGMLSSTFRELKPGVIDAMFDAFAPLRWCLFVEPVQVYCGQPVRIEAVLANEDMLSPGDYPVRFQVVGPQNASVFDQTVTVTIADSKTGPEPEFAIPVLDEQAAIDGPPGKYRFFATFQKNAAAAGGDVEFYAAAAEEMPEVKNEIVLWGDDPNLANWLDANDIAAQEFDPSADVSRNVILVGANPPPAKAEAFRELVKQIARGSHAVFLSPEVFHEGDDRTRWLPLANKGTLADLPVWLYHKDDWAKNHPIFEGLPAGCVLDHTFYREILGAKAFAGQDVPSEVVAGAINTCLGYSSGLSLAIYNLGEGRFTVNTLRILENLGTDPVAERLLRNMLNYAARHVDLPPAPLPADYDAHLRAIGY